MYIQTIYNIIKKGDTKPGLIPGLGANDSLIAGSPQ